MRTLTVFAFAFLVLPFVGAPARASCQVIAPDENTFPHTAYVTACALDQGVTGDDGTQRTTHNDIVHVSHAIVVDPVFDVIFVRSDQTHWTYDDGTIHQDRRSTDTGFGLFQGVSGLVGWGAQARLIQRDQNAPEAEGEGACSSFVGTSSCAGSSGWFAVNGVASVGAGAYYSQMGKGADCRESTEVDVDAAVAFVPVSTGPGACTTELPWVYDSLP